MMHCKSFNSSFMVGQTASNTTETQTRVQQTIRVGTNGQISLYKPLESIYFVYLKHHQQHCSTPFDPSPALQCHRLQGLQRAGAA